MKFHIKTTSGGEVVFAGQHLSGPVCYAAPPATGLWHISLPRFEDWVAERLNPLEFGQSVEAFFFGFEIGELTEWAEWFLKTAEYASYKPSIKSLVAVGQVEWRHAKDLPAAEQLELLCGALNTAAARFSTMKRKPKDFQYAAFAEAIKLIATQCPLGAVIVHEQHA